MTPRQQAIWEKACRMAIKETFKINEGHFDALFYRVALDYYTKLLVEDVKRDILRGAPGKNSRIENSGNSKIVGSPRK